MARAFIIGDLHFGLRSNNMDWLEITRSYFYDFLIPLLQKEYQEGDVVIQVGDVFDNRQSINIKVQHLAINCFEAISKIMPVFIIAGNHDTYYLTSNEVSSIDCLKFIPNIYIYKKPEILKFGKERCLMLPWCATPEIETQHLNQYAGKADWIFSHSEARGFMLNKKVEQDHGTSLSDYSGFKRVYSGHIHYSQVRNNVIMVGNAYQMTRSDSDNKKGVYLLDFNTGEHVYFENSHSPKFVKMTLSNSLELTLGQIKTLVRNNFVDLYIASDIPIKYNLSLFMSMIQDVARKIDPNIYDEKIYIDIENITEEIQNGYKNFNVLNLCSKYIENMNTSQEIKERLITEIGKLYTDCLQNYKKHED